MRFLWAIFTAVMLSGAAQGGTLTATDSPHCSARFEGQIVKGDFALFQDMIPRLKQAERKEYEFGNAGICLNSPGGSMLEATRIATYLEDQRIGTVIDDGDTCLSACSIIFMLGADDEASTLNTEIVGNRILLEFDRKMHMNATLGFHRPDLKLQEQSGFTSQDMEKSFDIAVLSVLEFVRVANNWKQKEGTTAIAPDLLQEMLQHEGQDFFYIDTVDKAGRWDIDVFGYQRPQKASAREALNSCDNLSNWVSGLAPIPVEGADIETLKKLTNRYSQWFTSIYEDHPATLAIYTIGGRDQFYHADGGIGERYCQISLEFPAEDNYFTPVHGCGGDAVLGQSFFEWCGRQDFIPVMDFFGALAIFPSNLPLRELDNYSRKIESEADAIETQLMPQPTLSCGKNEGDWIAVVAPQGTVAVHGEPDPNTPQIATLYNYASLQRGDSSGRLFGSEDTQKACYDACSAYANDPDAHRSGTTEVAQTIQSCFDNDAIWWSVTLRDGTTGYASAKYLR